MSDTYTKLFSSLTESTVWCEPYATRILWVTMLAMADARGKVYGSVPGLARRANITREECDAALASFRAPDIDSRTKEHDGRRIEDIDGGWLLLNHAKYAAVRNEAERREYKRQWDREHRSKSDNSPTKSDTSDASPSITTAPTPPALTPTPPQERADAAQAPPAPAKRGSRLPDDWMPSDELLGWASKKHPGVPLQLEIDKFRDFWRAKAGRDGAKLDWTATFRNWIRNARPAGGFAQPPAQAGSGAHRPYVPENRQRRDPSAGAPAEFSAIAAKLRIKEPHATSE